MTEHRELLNTHWTLLTSYMNPTDAMIDALILEKVIPPSMGDDIRKSKSQEDKNVRILTSLKIVGSSAFSRFRHVLLEHGHIFLAEMLWDENGTQFIEECDFDNYPSFKNSLNPLERKQLIRIIDSKIKARMLKSEWRNGSEERIKKLQINIASDRRETEDMKKKILVMKNDLSSKNETLKSVIKDFNSLNDDVVNFEQRHQYRKNGILPTSLGAGDHNITSKTLETVDLAATQNSRFRFIDTCIGSMDQRLSMLLGEGDSKPFVSLQELDEKTVKVKELIRDMEVKMDANASAKKNVEDILFPNEPEEKEAALLQTVHKYITREQNRSMILLKDIDNLSKKMRNIKESDANSGLLGLKQSAVTGFPTPEMVDHRFIRNHIALLNADAEHMQKRFQWMLEELRELKSGKYLTKSSSEESTSTKKGRCTFPAL